MEAPVKGRKVVDLMEALRASIALTENEKGEVKAKEGPAVPEVTDSDQLLEKPKSSLTPRKRTTRRAKEA